MPAIENMKINYCVLVKVNVVDKFLKILLNVEKKIILISANEIWFNRTSFNPRLKLIFGLLYSCYLRATVSLFDPADLALAVLLDSRYR